MWDAGIGDFGGGGDDDGCDDGFGDFGGDAPAALHKKPPFSFERIERSPTSYYYHHYHSLVSSSYITQKIITKRKK